MESVVTWFCDNGSCGGLGPINLFVVAVRELNETLSSLPLTWHHLSLEYVGFVRRIW